MDKALKQAWRVIDWMIAEDYYGERNDMIDEVGDLDDLAVNLSEVIEEHDLVDEADIIFLTAEIDLLYF